MKLQDMYPAVLTFMLIAILIGVGLTVLGNTSDAVRKTTTQTDDNFTAINGTCVSLTYDYISSSTASFENHTTGNDLPASCFVWDNTAFQKGSCVTLQDTPSGCWAVNGTSVNTTYSYGASTEAVTSITNGVTAIGGFTTWFAVIVVILVAALIIGIVMRSFSGRG